MTDKPMAKGRGRVRVLRKLATVRAVWPAGRQRRVGLQGVQGREEEMSDLHYKPNRTKMFAGKCIDGPCEGEWHESNEAGFMVYYVVPMGRVLDPNDIDSIGGYGNHYFYIWLYGYRAWAWVQPYSLKGGK